MSITLPDVNLNGTSKAVLLDLHIIALEALRTAREALQGAAPNGRDYTPQGTAEGSAALQRAVKEHFDRLDFIDRVVVEVETIAEHLSLGWAGDD